MTKEMIVRTKGDVADGSSSEKTVAGADECSIKKAETVAEGGSTQTVCNPKEAAVKKKLLASFYHKNRFPLAIDAIAAVLGGICAVSVSWLMQQLIDTASGLKGSRPLSQLAVMSVGFLAFFLVCMFLDYASKPRFIRRAMRQYRETAFAEITAKNIASFRKESTATYLSALTNDATSIETNYLSGTLEMINQTVNFAGALALMLWYSPLMTLIAAGITLVPLVASVLTGNRLAPAEQKVSERNKEFTATLSDCLNGFTVVKSFRAETEISDLFRKKNRSLEQDKYKRLRIQSLVGIIGNLSGIMAQLGVFLVGAWLALSGRGLTAGIVIAFVNLMNNVLNPIARMPQLLAGRKASEALIDKLAASLCANSDEGGRTELPALREGIRLSGVSYGYEEGTDVLNGVDAFFEAGHSYAIVGGSGSGKSTLLNLLMAGSPDYRGTISFDGTELREASAESLYGLLSMIQQNVFVFDASIADNVTMFREFPKEELDAAITHAHLTELLRERGENYRCGENGSGLSGGEKQRISIARSLLRKSSVLLVDEATAALDNETAYRVSQDILDLDGVTRIVVTHSLEESLLKRYDGILVLRNGRIEENGTFDELMARDGYFKALYTVAQ